MACQKNTIKKITVAWSIRKLLIPCKIYGLLKLRVLRFGDKQQAVWRFNSMDFMIDFIAVLSFLRQFDSFQIKEIQIK